MIDRGTRLQALDDLRPDDPKKAWILWIHYFDEWYRYGQVVYGSVNDLLCFFTDLHTVCLDKREILGSGAKPKEEDKKK